MPAISTKTLQPDIQSDIQARSALKNGPHPSNREDQLSGKGQPGSNYHLLQNRTQTLQPVQTQPVQNRVRVLLVHIPKLSIRGQARLATEVGVSRSTISRLVNGRINPSYRLARGVTSALERLIGYPLDMRDVFTTDGTFLTPSGCALCKCGGCFPDHYYDGDDALRPERCGEKPGDWSLTPVLDTKQAEYKQADKEKQDGKGERTGKGMQ